MRPGLTRAQHGGIPPYALRTGVLHHHWFVQRAIIPIGIIIGSVCGPYGMPVTWRYYCWYCSVLQYGWRYCWPYSTGHSVLLLWYMLLTDLTTNYWPDVVGITWFIYDITTMVMTVNSLAARHYCDWCWADLQFLLRGGNSPADCDGEEWCVLNDLPVTVLCGIPCWLLPSSVTTDGRPWEGLWGRTVIELILLIYSVLLLLVWYYTEKLTTNLMTIIIVIVVMNDED